MFMKCDNLGFGVQMCVRLLFETPYFIMHLKLRDLLVSIWLKTEFNWSLKNYDFDFCHVLLRYSGILGFGVQVCLLVIWTPYYTMHLKLWNLLLSLWLKTKYEVYFQVRKQQALLWKPHNITFIWWSFFAINDNLLVDMLNLQMLKCIIY